MRFLYLHGFASSPASRKAEAFRSAFADRGYGLEIPDLAGGDFEHLTISGQLAVVSHLLRNEPARLVGSSMGGYLAALYGSLHPEIDRMVLLAPAFSMAAAWNDPDWRVSGFRDFYHHSDKRIRRVHYGLIEDALRFDPEPRVNCPVRVFHGIHDSVVPIDVARQWAKGQPAVKLTEVDSDHELMDVLDLIITESVPFLCD